MLTKKQLHNELYYDRNTGEFFRVNTKGVSYSNDPAGSLTPSGYISITINQKSYMAHRLVMLYEYGLDSEMNVDHIDGDPTNNKRENLRLVTHKENMKNKSLNRNNKTGINGVQFVKGRFRLFVGKKYVTSSESIDEIKELSARELGNRGYHKNHGKRPPFNVAIAKERLESRRVACSNGLYEKRSKLEIVRSARGKSL